MLDCTGFHSRPTRRVEDASRAVAAGALDQAVRRRAGGGAAQADAERRQGGNDRADGIDAARGPRGRARRARRSPCPGRACRATATPGTSCCRPRRWSTSAWPPGTARDAGSRQVASTAGAGSDRSAPSDRPPAPPARRGDRQLVGRRRPGRRAAAAPIRRRSAEGRRLMTGCASAEIVAPWSGRPAPNPMRRSRAPGGAVGIGRGCGRKRLTAPVSARSHNRTLPVQTPPDDARPRRDRPSRKRSALPLRPRTPAGWAPGRPTSRPARAPGRRKGWRCSGSTCPTAAARSAAMPTSTQAALHPDDRHLAADFHALADRQDSFIAEYRIVRPDGATLWLSGRGLVMSRRPDGRAERLVSIMADVSERKLAEESLRLMRERLALALAGRADGRLRPRHRQRRALVGAADLRGVRRLARHLHADPRVASSTWSIRTTGKGFVQGRLQALARRRALRPRVPLPATGRPHHLDQPPRPGRVRRRRPAGAQLRRLASTSPSASSPSRRCRRPTGRRTASSRRWRTSCAIRWRRSATPSSVLRSERPRRSAGRLVPRRDRPPGDADGAAARRPARRLAHHPRQDRAAPRAAGAAGRDRACARDRPAADRGARAPALARPARGAAARSTPT